MLNLGQKRKYRFLPNIKEWIQLIFIGLFFFLVINDSIISSILEPFSMGKEAILYQRATQIELVRDHCMLVVLSTLAAVLSGVGLGIFATRKIGKEFEPLIQDICSFSQTFPPVAVLALTVPVVGFGFTPTLIALFLFSLLPIVNNTIAGIRSISMELLDAAVGTGMTKTQVLFKLELPISARIIWAGVRTAVVINVGTATIGALVGAGGLGAPIMSGLEQDNPAMIIQGAFSAGFIALSFDWFFGGIEKRFYTS